MQFFQSVTLLACAAFAAAQSTSVAIYNFPDTVKVGQAVPITLKSGNGPFTLTLRRGNPNDLQNVSTITTTGTGSSYNWTPDSNLENGSDYAIMISQGEQSNYTPEFTITGGKAAGSAPKSSSSSSAAGYAGAPTTFSSAAKTGSASGCAVTQIGDGQPQAPSSCISSSASVVATPASNSTASAAPAGSPGPYMPQAGATGSPATPASNSTAPIYSMPAPTSGNSGSSSGGSRASGSAAPKQTGAAAQFGSSLALVAGAAAAFVFLN